ncbi:MAG: hypothetical protein M3O09_11380 [Acidobacteriota bacterium]|nr:hypothetical protein [Acidobacteriota bacterium]
MGLFRFRQTLYLSARWLVISSALAPLFFQVAGAQRAAQKNVSKGPRALALVEVPPKGKAHLIPVTIVVDGKFYDASAYKAAPVPMALEYGTVYEAFRAGISQGFFTVGGVLHEDATWRGEGKWQSAAEIKSVADAMAAKKAAAAAKKPSDDAEGRPTLRRSNSEKANNPPPPSEKSTPPANTPTADSTPTRAAEEKPEAKVDQEPVDPNRPALRRGIPPARQAGKAEDGGDPAANRLSATSVGTKSTSKDSGAAKTSIAANPGKDGVVKIFAAISDAGSPETHSYAYDLKPGEEAKFRKRMLEMAADEVRKREQQLDASSSQQPPRVAGKPSKVDPSKPDFEDIDFRVLDISSSNEPVLVLTAHTSTPKLSTRVSPPANRDYMVTLVARDDIYGELHKAFASVADSDHLDAIPRLEFIDAVDADGDGRAELLFRQTSDAGSAFSIYRVIGNQLWPLFQGTPGR